MTPGRWAQFFLIALVMNACTSTTVRKPIEGDKEAYEDRLATIGAVDEWRLVGRISLDNGDDGGSGKLQWEVAADHSTIDFHGAMGRGAWHLEISPESAVLKEANGNEHRASGVDKLIQQQMGWPVPVEALQWWVRGLAAPGSIEDRQLDEKGLLVGLAQFGWQIAFNRYDSDSGVAMPTRLDARRENYRVKLAVSHWQIEPRKISD
jgi:outer membrane lipoprotein LolB